MIKAHVAEIGVAHIKCIKDGAEQRHFNSGTKMFPDYFVAKLKEKTSDWKIDNVSIGLPSPVRGGKIIKEPKHIGKGWVDFDFEKSLGKPTRVINDAAMQALGSYHGGRMPFLWFGTGLGSALAL